VTAVLLSRDLFLGGAFLFFSLRGGAEAWFPDFFEDFFLPEWGGAAALGNSFNLPTIEKRSSEASSSEPVSVSCDCHPIDPGGVNTNESKSSLEMEAASRLLLISAHSLL
jgi:hypothetical protein